MTGDQPPFSRLVGVLFERGNVNVHDRRSAPGVTDHPTDNQPTFLQVDVYTYAKYGRGLYMIQAI